MSCYCTDPGLNSLVHPALRLEGDRGPTSPGEGSRQPTVVVEELRRRVSKRGVVHLVPTHDDPTVGTLEEEGSRGGRATVFLSRP